MIDGKDVIRSYIQNFDRLHSYTHDNNNTVTTKIIQYFMNFGEMLGYHVFVEEFNKQDLVWTSPENPLKSLVLHMETENKIGVKRNLEKTFPRLKGDHYPVDIIKPKIKIAIMHGFKDMMEEDLEVYTEILEDWDLDYEDQEVIFIITFWDALKSGEPLELFGKRRHPKIILHKHNFKGRMIIERELLSLSLNDKLYEIINQENESSELFISLIPEEL